MLGMPFRSRVSRSRTKASRKLAPSFNAAESTENSLSTVIAEGFAVLMFRAGAKHSMRGRIASVYMDSTRLAREETMTACKEDCTYISGLSVSGIPALAMMEYARSGSL
jgi:hypothetical protein